MTPRARYGRNGTAAATHGCQERASTWAADWLLSFLSHTSGLAGSIPKLGFSPRSLCQLPILENCSKHRHSDAFMFQCAQVPNVEAQASLCLGIGRDADIKPGVADANFDLPDRTCFPFFQYIIKYKFVNLERYIIHIINTVNLFITYMSFIN